MVFSMFLFGALGHWGLGGTGQATQFTRAQPPAARVDGTTAKNRSAKDKNQKMPVARPDADSAGPITAPSGTHGVTKIQPEAH